MTSLSIYPSRISRHLARPLVLHRTLNSYIVNGLTRIIRSTQRRQKELVDKFAPIFAIIQQIHIRFSLLFDSRSNAVDVFLRSFWSLEESTIAPFDFVIIIAGEVAKSFGCEDYGCVFHARVTDAEADILVPAAIEHVYK